LNLSVRMRFELSASDLEARLTKAIVSRGDEIVIQPSEAGLWFRVRISETPSPLAPTIVGNIFHEGSGSLLEATYQIHIIQKIYKFAFILTGSIVFCGILVMMIGTKASPIWVYVLAYLILAAVTGIVAKAFRVSQGIGRDLLENFRENYLLPIGAQSVD